MIEIVTDNDRNLKNIKQIGTPKENNKIYIENFAYAKIKESSYKEKKVFVLMGHTEKMEGRYATFIEAAISVKEIDFAGTTPRWNNSTWKEVFQEIKRLYEDMIIVGWAVDLKGMRPRITPDLERVHREHFGGVHQLLFLLDSLEQEETFYIYKENKLVSKDGFYIYHRAHRKEELEKIPIKVLPEVNVEVEVLEKEPRRGGVYRQMMQEQKREKTSDGGNTGLAIAVAMLLFVIGVGVYENRDDIFGNNAAIETNVQQEQVSTETGIQILEESKETDTETIIPVEVIPGTEKEE